MIALRRDVICRSAIGLTALVSSAGRAQTGGSVTAKERLIGAWHLVRIDAPGQNKQSNESSQPKGMLIYTRDGHMSVQLMYPQSFTGLSNEYVRNGYEASFGTYDVDEPSHIVTHHVQGSITRESLVGKDLPRKFEFRADGRLLVRSANPAEHWSVTWEHD